MASPDRNTGGKLTRRQFGQLGIGVGFTVSSLLDGGIWLASSKSAEGDRDKYLGRGVVADSKAGGRLVEGDSPREVLEFSGTSGIVLPPGYRLSSGDVDKVADVNGSGGVPLLPEPRPRPDGKSPMAYPDALKGQVGRRVMGDPFVLRGTSASKAPIHDGNTTVPVEVIDSSLGGLKRNKLSVDASLYVKIGKVTDVNGNEIPGPSFIPDIFVKGRRPAPVEPVHTPTPEAHTPSPTVKPTATPRPVHTPTPKA